MPIVLGEVDSHSRPPLADLVLIASNLEALSTLFQSHDRDVRQLDLVSGCERFKAMSRQ